MPIVGIDLGTTNSLIACFQDARPIVIPNVFGEYLTPSVVSVDDNGEIYIGRIAKERLVSHPLLTASVFKRTMGSKKQYKLGSGTFSSEELSSFIIKKLKEDAENFLGMPVTEAVISVPAYFNDAQRRATKYAGELAGLKVERIVNEPTAASLAHGFHEEGDYAKYIVFDLGGGTFDVSILEKYDSVMEVRAVAGDIFLGGEDFTHVLMRIFAHKTRLDITSLSEIQRAILQKNIEASKCAFAETPAVHIRHMLEDKTYEAEITLNEFSRECDDLLSRLRIPVKKALTDASLSLSGIDNIVLVGGATKLPIIQSFVKKLFKRFPSYAVDPEQAVALGTAIHAALKERNQAISEMVLTDVCPFTLGVETVSRQASGIYYSDLYSPIIERNTVIPVSRVERYSTLHDNQPDIHCKILQGESHRASDNVLLGEITVPVPKAPAGQEAADVRFTYDINGILEVEVTIVSTQIKKNLIIEKNPGALTQEEIKQRLENLADYKIHPRDQEEHRLLLSRAERLYQESLGDLRQILGKEILDFNIVLDSQDNRKIRDHAVVFKTVLDEIELNI